MRLARYIRHHHHQPHGAHHNSLTRHGMDQHGERRSSAHGAAAARAWRGGGGGALPPPQPPKVYRVEPRDFRELVQRLTGAGSAGVDAPGPAAQQRVTPAMAAESRRLEEAATAAAAQQFDYASWYSAPLLSPAYGAAGFGGYPGGGPLL